MLMDMMRRQRIRKLTNGLLAVTAGALLLCCAASRATAQSTLEVPPPTQQNQPNFGSPPPPPQAFPQPREGEPIQLLPPELLMQMRQALQPASPPPRHPQPES